MYKTRRRRTTIGCGLSSGCSRGASRRRRRRRSSRLVFKQRNTQESSVLRVAQRSREAGCVLICPILREQLGDVQRHLMATHPPLAAHALQVTALERYRWAEKGVRPGGTKLGLLRKHRKWGHISQYTHAEQFGCRLETNFTTVVVGDERTSNAVAESGLRQGRDEHGLEAQQRETGQHNVVLVAQLRHTFHDVNPARAFAYICWKRRITQRLHIHDGRHIKQIFRSYHVRLWGKHWGRARETRTRVQASSKNARIALRPVPFTSLKSGLYTGTALVGRSAVEIR